jgi:hypothetical protein
MVSGERMVVIMSQLFEDVAKHGFVYCEYNQALISAQNLDHSQKMRLIKALIEDVYTTATENYQETL